VKKIVQIEIEEFESGAWVADAVSLEAFDGSFELDGETWTGVAVTERQDGDRYLTRIVGGAGKLAELIEDKYYDGSVSLQVAIQDVCRACGETFGSAVAGKFLTTFQRIRMPAYAALDAIAAAFDMLWFISRDGKVHMVEEREAGDEAEARLVIDGDGSDSALLREPNGVAIGDTVSDRAVRHLRWTLTPEKFEARAYFLPFVFRPPTRSEYASMRDAKVDRQNADGTIDVIVSGRFGMTKVPFYCGVPHSKVKVDSGDKVMVGFFGSDPQKPFAVSMAQDTAATKEVARKGDSVHAGSILVVSPPSGGTCTVTYVAHGGTPVPGLTALDGGKITSGSERLKVGD
jgi:hypothetical protein